MGERVVQGGVPRGVPRADRDRGRDAAAPAGGISRGRGAPDRDSSAFYFTLVPVRPRRRGERRSLRTFSPGASLRPPLAFNPDTPRRLSTPLLTPFNSTPTFARMDPRPSDDAKRGAVRGQDGAAKKTQRTEITACSTPSPVALLYGTLTAEHYEDSISQDPRIDELRRKTVVTENPQYSADYADPDRRSVANAVQVHFRVRSIHWSPYDRVGVVNAVS